MIQQEIADLRLDYRQAQLLEQNASQHPITQFTAWWQDVLAAKIEEPNAMVVSTVDEHLQPHSRVVLLKSYNQQGFIFFSNYQSNKAQQLQNNTKASVLFFWKELERQVRITGQVQKIDAAESEAYFRSRPIGSQLGAIASQQSTIIANREVLEQNYQDLEQQYGQTNSPQIPMPNNWGGYIVIPNNIEFWQGRSSRLHDRLLYSLQTDGNWGRERLSP